MAASRSGIWGWIRALFCLLLFFPVPGLGSQEATKQWLVDQIQADGSLDSPASKAITFQSTTEAAINLLDADQSLAGVESGIETGTRRGASDYDEVVFIKARQKAFAHQKHGYDRQYQGATSQGEDQTRPMDAKSKDWSIPSFESHCHSALTSLSILMAQEN